MDNPVAIAVIILIVLAIGAFVAFRKKTPALPAPEEEPKKPEAKKPELEAKKPEPAKAEPKKAEPKATSQDAEPTKAERKELASTALEAPQAKAKVREEDIPVALAPFGQVDSRLARKYEGTGLGLALVKAYVERHGGTLAITTAPGKGTCVTVRLKAAEGDRTETPRDTIAA